MPAAPTPARGELQDRLFDADEIDWLRSHLRAEIEEAVGCAFHALKFDVISSPTVHDGSTIVRVRDTGTKAPLAVVSVSSVLFPDMVDRAMEGAEMARELLGPQLGSHVLVALARARPGGRSCAVLPYCQALREVALLRRLDSLRVSAAVFDWRLSVTRATVFPATHEGTRDRFADRLAHLASLAVVDDDVRRSAKVALQRLESGAWRPRHALMHGDLWRGNLLLRRPAAGAPREGVADRFVVSDWPGAERQGYPIFDLVRLALSLGTGQRRLAAEIARHCEALGCERRDASGSLLAGLGHIALSLGEFPIERFAIIVRACHGAVAEA